MSIEEKEEKATPAPAPETAVRVVVPGARLETSLARAHALVAEIEETPGKITEELGLSGDSEAQILEDEYHTQTKKLVERLQMLTANAALAAALLFNTPTALAETDSEVQLPESTGSDIVQQSPIEVAERNPILETSPLEVAPQTGQTSESRVELLPEREAPGEARGDLRLDNAVTAESTSDSEGLTKEQVREVFEMSVRIGQACWSEMDGASLREVVGVVS